jgi:nucleoside-diphosphate-sugar epimerase
LPQNLKRFAPLTGSRLEFLTHSRVYDVTKAQRVLDFAAPTALATGAARSMAWYRQQGYLAAVAT